MSRYFGVFRLGRRGLLLLLFLGFFSLSAHFFGLLANYSDNLFLYGLSLLLRILDILLEVGLALGDAFDIRLACFKLLVEAQTLIIYLRKGDAYGSKFLRYRGYMDRKLS